MIRRILKRVVNKVVGGNDTPRSTPTPTPAPAPQREPIPNEELPSWMQQEANDGHSHSHGHSHDHGGGNDHAADEASPAADNIMIVPSDTPNPNAFKFTVNRQVVAQGSMSFNSPEEAKGNGLGEALFAIDGVASIFGVNDFVTVTKADAVTWDKLIPAIESALKTGLAD